MSFQKGWTRNAKQEPQDGPAKRTHKIDLNPKFKPCVKLRNAPALIFWPVAILGQQYSTARLRDTTKDNCRNDPTDKNK